MFHWFIIMDITRVGHTCIHTDRHTYRQKIHIILVCNNDTSTHFALATYLQMLGVQLVLHRGWGEHVGPLGSHIHLLSLIQLLLVDMLVLCWGRGARRSYSHSRRLVVSRSGGKQASTAFWGGWCAGWLQVDECLHVWKRVDISMVIIAMIRWWYYRV